MRYFLPFVITVLACAVGRSTTCVEAQAAAEDKPVEAAYPFSEALPDYDKGRELAAAVVQGDEDSVKEFRRTGLTFVPHLAGYALRNVELLDAMWRHRDWFADMRRWELALVNAEPAEVLKLYKELAPRFRIKEAQLARAALYAWRYGDRDTLKALVALAPDSPWVKGAQGHIAEGMERRKAVEQMLAILPQMDQARRLQNVILPSLFAEPEERYSRRSRESIEADVAGSNKPESIMYIHAGPSEWRYSLFYERLGALACETGDEEFVGSVETRVRDFTSQRPELAVSLRTFQLSAWYGMKNLGAQSGDVLASTGADSCGPGIVLYAISYPQPWQWQERALAAVAAWSAMPDNTLCRRFLLSRCMVAAEPTLARMSARAVLALYDDDLCSYRDVGRALLRFGTEPALTKAWAEALKATENPELVKLAEIVNKGAADMLEPVVHKALGLNVAQKAALLAVFCTEAERATHGGIEGTYWLNRAAFHEAVRNIHEARQAHWQAMRCAESDKPAPEITANMMQYLLFADRTFLPVQFDRDIDVARKSLSTLADKVEKVRASFFNRQATIHENAPLQAMSALRRRAPLKEELLKELTDKPMKWGGTGLMLAADSELAGRNYPARREWFFQAVNTSPLCMHVHTRATPENENFGTLAAANWHYAAVHCIALALLQPFSPDTITVCGSVWARSGNPPVPLASLVMSAHTRHTAGHWGGNAESHGGYLAYRAAQLSHLFHRRALADPDRVSGARLDALENMRVLMDGGFDSDKLMGYLAVIGGASPAFAEFTISTYAASHNMSDVNNLLNFSIKTCFLNPSRAIGWVNQADRIGVSNYGRFVGTQSLCGARAQLGQLDDVLERYREMRGGDVGYPPYLDVYLLGGLTHGNQWASADKAIEEVSKFDQSKQNAFFHFAWRRTLMMAGKHKELRQATLPENAPISLEGCREYSHLFHEARSMLNQGTYELIQERAKPYLSVSVEDGMGVYLDAALLHAIAAKLIDPDVVKEGKLAAIEPAFVDFFLGGTRLLDWEVLEMLCGRKPLAELPERNADWAWHGDHYAERPAGMYGAGRITYLEVTARDPYVRGVLAWLRDDKAAARLHLQKCKETEVRSCHEYHVADWLLQHELKEK